MAHAAAPHEHVVQDVNPFMQVLSPKSRLSCSACSLLGKLLYPPGPLQIPLNPKRSTPNYTDHYAYNYLINSSNHTDHYANDLSNPPPNLSFPTPSSTDPAFTLDFTTSQPNITCHFDRLHKDLALHLQLQEPDADYNNTINQRSSIDNDAINLSNAGINLSLQQSVNDSTNPNLQSLTVHDSVNLNLQPSRKNSVNLQHSIDDDSVNLNLQPSRRGSLSHKQHDINLFNSMQFSGKDDFDHENPSHFTDNGSVNHSLQPSSIRKSYDEPSKNLDNYKKPKLKVEVFRTSEKGFGIRILQSLEPSNLGSCYSSLEAKNAHIRQSNNSSYNAKLEKDNSSASSDFNHPTTCSSPNLDHVRTSFGKFSPAQIDDSGPPSKMSEQRSNNDDMRPCTCDSPCGDPNCGCPSPIAHE